MLNIYFGEMEEAIYNPAVYFKNTYQDSWINKRAFKHAHDNQVFNASTCGDNCAHWLLKMGMEKNITINLRHLMDFGEKEFTIHILNTDEIVHNMEELVVIAGMFVR